GGQDRRSLSESNAAIVDRRAALRDGGGESDQLPWNERSGRRSNKRYGGWRTIDLAEKQGSYAATRAANVRSREVPTNVNVPADPRQATDDRAQAVATARAQSK